MEEVGFEQASPAANTQTGVLSVGERKFAVGLTWLAFDLEPNNAVLKQRLEKFDADYYCVRQTIANQQGFGYIRKGHKSGMKAAASIAADTLIGDWHGVFVAEHGWWYVAVHSDNISPGGDQFFLTEEEAYNCFTEQANLFNWPRSYAPATWNIEDANPDIPLNKLLEEDNQVPKLQAATFDAIFGGKQRRNFVLFIAMIIMGVLLSVAILPKLAEKAKQERNRSLGSNIVVPVVIKAPPKLVRYEEVDTQNEGFKLPQPSKVLEYCSAGFAMIVEPLPGWDFKGVSCDVVTTQNTTRSTIEWTNSNGSFDLVKGYLKRFSTDIYIVYDGSSKITARFSKGNLAQTHWSPRVLKREDQVKLLHERFSGLGTLNLSIVTPNARKTANENNRNRFLDVAAPKTPPAYLKMTLLTSMPPDVLSLYFDVPGLKLKKTSWDVNSKAWNYEAEILYQSPQFFEYYEIKPYNE